MSDVEAMVAWLRSVLDADEQAAREAMSRSAGEWRFAPDELGIWPDYVSAVDDSTEYPLVTGAQSYVGDMINEGIGAHIARHDPADTLARIEGERAILDQYEQAVDLYEGDREAPDGVAALEIAVRALAFGYRHRDGWQEGWAP
ncbi:hypothetical protein F4561_002698 [Lipingzhangella halophila]|uniref:Uncharacterized protein n=1 Tax=Lipingzhangella halophila TaxID=1783352 RepID=A0A7W7RH40_9ACTN|nr:DUF6221 family protein [Lipingzhangella halophila]MBB4931878.1 hypothetical protein [Lipingzhangella halophila]